MELSELMEMVVGLTVAATFFAAAVLSIIFVFKHPKYRWRLLPALSFISFFIISCVPESGWSDIRSQWHQPVLILIWGVLVLVMATTVLRSERSALCKSLRVAFGIAGIACLVGSIFSLVESWQFLHGF